MTRRSRGSIATHTSGRPCPTRGCCSRNTTGPGHFSQDNYISLVSGQATESVIQTDCPYYTHFAGHVDLKGSLKTNRNYGQMKGLRPGPRLPGSGQRSAQRRREVQRAPFATPGPTGSTTDANPGSADATDQYVPKHFPFPWFESILGSGDCNAKHIADVFSKNDGLLHDLRHESTTPTFSWITPNNCSDAHDALCHGNNLSGGFANATTPRAPVNDTGGLYAADLFLAHVIPEIEASKAFKDGGLIDVTFDEAFPPFTYTGNSFANSKTVPPNAQTSLHNDSAAETLFGRTVQTEPTGPNTPLGKDQDGNELYPGPGFNAFIDRPSNCVAQTTPKQPAGTCILGGGNHVPGARTDAKATAPVGSSTIDDNAAVATDPGRTVTGTGIPRGAHVGQVTDTPVPATASNQDGGFVDKGSFQLVDGAGHPITTTGPVSGVVLGVESPQTDPLYDAKDPTTGGGDTGSVLISPYIRPGSVSRRFYNHYSWLRTIEDLFSVGADARGLDGSGHIGYAAQPGLAPFGIDVFNRPNGPSGHGKGKRASVLPSWLPSASMPAGHRIVTAAPSRHRLAIEGDTRRSRRQAPASSPSPSPQCTEASRCHPVTSASSASTDSATGPGHSPRRRPAAAANRRRTPRHADAQIGASGGQWPASLGTAWRQADRILGLRRGNRLTRGILSCATRGCDPRPAERTTWRAGGWPAPMRSRFAR